MKKRVWIGILWLWSMASLAFSQPITSVADGNWTNPFTWSCTCVPLPGSVVSIQHQVALTNDYAYSAGAISVQSGGALLADGRWLAITGSGELTVNNGKLQVEYLFHQSTAPITIQGNDTAFIRVLANLSDFDNSAVVVMDSFYNDGILQNLGNGHFIVPTFFNDSTLVNEGAFIEMDSFFNNGSLTNTGTIEVFTFYNNKTLLNQAGSIFNVDSITNAGNLYNADAASILADSFLNVGELTNHGLLDFNYIFNSDLFINNGRVNFWYLTNADRFTNNDSLIGDFSFWNWGDFTNAVGSFFEIGGSFDNFDPLGGTAIFTNHGQVNTLDSWTNSHTIQGYGNFTVQNLSHNGGNMLEGFDFCDYTPPATAPYIDLNTGFISTDITFCNPSGITTETSGNGLFFPNPVRKELYWDNVVGATFRLYNQLGELVGTTTSTERNSWDLTALPSGIYWLQVELGSTTRVYTIEKQ